MIENFKLSKTNILALAVVAVLFYCLGAYWNRQVRFQVVGINNRFDGTAYLVDTQTGDTWRNVGGYPRHAWIMMDRPDAIKQAVDSCINHLKPNQSNQSGGAGLHEEGLDPSLLGPKLKQ